MARSFEAYSLGCLLARLPEPLASRIREIAGAIPDEFVHDDEDGELGREDSPHVTVKYGLHTSDPDEVMEKVSGWPAFPITLGKTSVFHGDGDFVVLKLGVQSRDLMALNRHVSKVFDVTDTHPQYRPHVTIAYMVKNPEDPYYYREFYTDEFEGQVVEIEELEFSPADGPKHIIPLGGTDDRFQAMQILGMAKDLLGMS